MNPNSAALWLPKLEAYGLPTPRTVAIPYNHRAISSIFDGEESAEFARIVAAIHVASRVIGYPTFIRTDLGSAKHSGPKAYKLTQTASAAPLLYKLLEDQEMKFWLEPQGPQVILVREFLHLESKFEAFRGLPVNREFRFFSDGSRVICAHPYWPADSIEDHVDETKYPNWRSDLDILHALPEEMPILSSLAVTAAKVQGCGRWSVDFAQDTTGKWWLIDMAVMEDSFHWPGCLDLEGQK